MSKHRTCKLSSRQQDAQEHPAACSRVHQELSTAPLLAQESSVPAESSLQAGLPFPRDSQKLGPWEEQGVGALSTLITEMRLGRGCWRKDCSCLMEQPGLGDKGYSPSTPPNPVSLVQVPGQKQLLGTRD